MPAASEVPKWSTIQELSWPTIAELQWELVLQNSWTAFKVDKLDKSSRMSFSKTLGYQQQQQLERQQLEQHRQQPLAKR